MPLPDLWMVTAALQDVIKTKAAEAYLGAGSVDVTVGSPQEEDTSGTTPIINIYLFHVIENAHYKNQPARTGSGPVPIQHIPIGLDVHYVLTVRAPDGAMRMQVEHRLLGITAKVVHDYPIITRGILFDQTILEEDDRFDLILRPVSIEESMNFWAGDDTKVTRPSLFVEARVIQLEPEPPQILPGIVLTVGTFVFAGRGPRITSSRNQIAFVPPGFSVTRVSAEPARVALHEQEFDPFSNEIVDTNTQDLIRLNNRLTLVGSGFGRGHRFLELRRVGDNEPNAARVLDLEPDQTLPAIDRNANWKFEVFADRISLSFFTTARDRNLVLTNFVPGIYTARVLLEQEPRAQVSNQTVFAVIPQVVDIDPQGGDVHELTIAGDYLQNTETEVVLVVGDLVFTEVASVAAPGQFTITGADTLEFQIATPAPGDLPLPVNLTVNSAQATPAWVEDP